VETPLALEMERQSSPSLTVYILPVQGGVERLLVADGLFDATVKNAW
jgi:hypothetical protein